MTVQKLCERLNAKVLAGEAGMNREIANCYIGDLLSWAMSRAKKDYVWLTIMGNRNAIAVASLADVSCIVLVDNAPLDDEAREKAQELQIPILSSMQSAYETAKIIAEMLN